jgi:hypothetical protein
MTNYLDRRRGARGMRAKPSLPDAHDAVTWFGRASAVMAGTADDQALYGVVQDALVQLCGFRLLTILRITPAGDGLQRMHSSNPAVYPAQGIKEVAGDPWLHHLLSIAEPELSPDADAVRRHFFDAQAIFDLGCESVLNLPVRHRGRNLGTLNLLHKADWYEPSHVAICLPFAALLGAAWGAQPVTP